MTDKNPRRFTIADVMILIAAAAVGLVMHRHHHASMNAAMANSWVWARAQTWLMEMAPFLLVSPPALLAARAIRPRPATRRIFRQPGTVACLACVFQEATSEVFYFLSRFRTAIQYSFDFHLYHALYMGSSVALAWGLQWLMGVWRPESGWIDRAGRGLGILLIVVWILLSLLS